MLGSNFIYKDQEVSVELTSVFNHLLNNHFVKYGAANLPKLELYKIISSLRTLINHDFVKQLQLLDVA